MQLGLGALEGHLVLEDWKPRRPQGYFGRRDLFGGRGRSRATRKDARWVIYAGRQLSVVGFRCEDTRTVMLLWIVLKPFLGARPFCALGGCKL